MLITLQHILYSILLLVPEEKRPPLILLLATVRTTKTEQIQSVKKQQFQKKLIGYPHHIKKYRGVPPPQRDSPVRVRESLKKSRVVSYIFFLPISETLSKFFYFPT